MSKQELDTLAAEAASADTDAPGDTAGNGGEGPEPEADRDPTADAGDGSSSPSGGVELAQALGFLFSLAGNIICARYRVSPLQPAEAEQLGQAAARVGALYDIQLSEKAAAWIGLGVTTLAIAAPRVIEYRSTIEGQAEEVEPEADARPEAAAAAGDDGDSFPMPGPDLDGAA